MTHPSDDKRPDHLVEDAELEKGHSDDIVTDTAARKYVDPTMHISHDESKALRHKIHRRVLPFLCLSYLCQALDKGTMGSSSIMGWQADVGAWATTMP